MKYLLLVFSLVSCSVFSGPKVDPKPDPQSIYKMDMDINVNGKQANGVIVVPKSAQYKISLKAPGQFDWFILTSCNREHAEQLEDDKVSYVYNPLAGPSAFRIKETKNSH